LLVFVAFFGLVPSSVTLKPLGEGPSHGPPGPDSGGSGDKTVEEHESSPRMGTGRLELEWRSQGIGFGFAESQIGGTLVKLGSKSGEGKKGCPL